MTTGKVNYEISANSTGMVSAVSKAERSVEGLDKAQTKAGRSAKEMGKSSSSIDKLKKSFSGLGSVIAGLGVGLAFKKMVDNTAKQDAAMAQLNQTLKSTEFAAGKTADELTRTAASLQQVTKFGDEAIIEMQALLLTFKDIKGDQFDRTTKAVLDMATAMKVDLKSASIQLGKALNDPARNLSALTRSGIQFTESQTAMIKEMQKAGDMAGAQAIILKELESQFGGSAKAARDTLGGAIAGLSNSFNDLFEAESKTSDSMVKGIKGIEKAITSPGFKAGIALVLTSLIKIFEWYVKIIKVANKAGEGIANFIDWARTSLGITDALDEAGIRLTETVELSTIAIGQRYAPAIKAAAEAQEILVAVTDDEKGSLDRLQPVIVTATRKHWDLTTATKEVAVATKEATEAQGPFQDALQDTVARIDTVFADAWRNIGDGAQDLFSNLLDGFKQTMAEMAHIALTRPIIMSIGAFGVGSGPAAAGGVGGLASGIGGIGSLLSGGAGSLLGSLGGVSTGIGNFLGAGSTLGNAALAQGRTLQYGTLGQGLGTVGMNLGAGVLGGLAGNAVFGGGGYSNVGATIGGIGGSFFGPVGAGVGSFLGSGIGSLLGGNGGNQAGFSDFNLATGQNNAQGSGKKFDQENVDAAGGIVAVLQQFSDVIGGSSFSGRVKVGNKSGIKLDGQKFDSAEDLFEDVFDDIIRAADNLEGPLRRIILGFEGTAEQTMQFAASVISLKENASFNSISQAIDDFTTQQPSVLQAYTDQTSTLQTLITNFDGSALAAGELAQTLAINKAAAYEFALAIQAIGEQIGILAADQAAYIRESVLTAEELRDARMAERDALSEGLSAMTDPEEVAASSKRILELNRKIFDSLSEDVQLVQAESFATYAENTNNVAQQVLESSLDGLKSTQEDINQRVNAMLQDTAAKQQRAADTQMSASREFAAWVRRLQSRGITVNLNQAAPEVNV